MNPKSTELNYYPLPSKKDLIAQYSEWLESRKDVWDLFAATAVFKAGGHKSNSARWSDEYKHKVLWKIKKRLAHSYTNLIPFEDFFYYEFEQSSLFKSAAEGRKPHHIHGVIPIPKNLTHKIWDSKTGCLTLRIQKDFKSIKTLSSILLEPIRTGKLSDWLSYSSKGKPFYQT